MRMRWVAAGLGVLGLALASAVLALNRGDGGGPRQEDTEASPAAQASSTAFPASATPTPTLSIDLSPTPGPGVTPLPGATPDPRRGGWWIPYENVEKMHPWFEGTLAGIRIQTTEYTLPAVECANIRNVPVEEDYFSLPLGYNPPGMLRDPGYGPASVWCGARLERAWAHFSYPPFTAESIYGGPIDIVRYRTEPIVQLRVRQHRAKETTIGGHPAVIAAPYLDDFSRGDAAVVVWDGEYITRITATNVRMAEVLRIAEGLFPPP